MNEENISYVCILISTGCSSLVKEKMNLFNIYEKNVKILLGCTTMCNSLVLQGVKLVALSLKIM